MWSVCSIQISRYPHMSRWKPLSQNFDLNMTLYTWSQVTRGYKIRWYISFFILDLMVTWEFTGDCEDVIAVGLILNVLITFTTCPHNLLFWYNKWGEERCFEVLIVFCHVSWDWKFSKVWSKVFWIHFVWYKPHKVIKCNEL